MSHVSIYVHVKGYGNIAKKGNAKLPKTTAIFNICSAHDCPSVKLGYCQAFNNKGKLVCYAYQAELQYPTVLEYRHRQERFWDAHTAKELAVHFGNIQNIDTLRIDEAGDFRNQEDVDKLQIIAKLLKAKGIRVYVYTARQDLDFSNTPDLVIMGSNFKEEGIDGIFKLIFDTKDKPKGFGLCPADCSKCVRCIMGKDTANLAHGPLIR